MLDHIGAGSGGITINIPSCHCTVLTELFQLNSLQLLCVKNLFSAAPVLALQARNVTGSCHEQDTVAGVTHCSDTSVK